MHLLATTTVALDEGEEAIDLGQSPGDVVVLSFTDSDLAAVAAAASREPDLPSLRLASLRRLRHPMSVDLYVDSVVAKAKFVLVRCLGGLDYWRYGLERVAAVSRAAGIPMLALSGDDRPDPRLAALSTVPPALARDIEAYWREGGVDNLRQMLRRVAAEIGGDLDARDPEPVPLGTAWLPASGPQTVDAALARLAPERLAPKRLAPKRPLGLILFYRSALLSGDTGPVEALAAALEARGLACLPLAVSSLKEPEAAEVVRRAIRARRPAVILAMTAFSAREDAGFVLDEADCPILQAIPGGSSREAWLQSPRGLGASDLAMQVALPEFDGRIVTRPISFKEEAPADPALGFACRRQVADPEGVAAVADLAAAWVRLAATPRHERRLALILSDYPARAGRAGFAVGLDTPASVARILATLVEAGYEAASTLDAPDLMRELTAGEPSFWLPLPAYKAWLTALPAGAREALLDAWGEPESDPSVDRGAFRFRAVRAGGILVALQPDRAPQAERKAAYHDLDRPPAHGYLAFYLALRAEAAVHGLVHLGTHGTLEWLPGKAVALSGTCWPQLALGALPVVYPFIVNDPGEAAPAKRRIGAVTLGHLTPPVTDAGLHGEAATVKDLVEELSSAQVLDPRRADLVARDILDRAEACGLSAECGVTAETPIGDALTRLDAHLCDLSEVAIRDGLHVFGEGFWGPLRNELICQISAASGTAGDAVAKRLDACPKAERDGLLAALDGRFVPPGPAGSPARGQLDALPTGRNLVTLDPRAVPTRAAVLLGERAAAEVVRRHLQDTGDWPRRIVMDLWASPTMRSGGEDIAHILALMGVRPTWDNASTRVTGFEILPLPLMDRPRADVTVRISGAFRDTFPLQLSLIDQAARAVARLEEDDDWNELAAARRRGAALSRVFGAAPGRFGAGVAALALDGDWSGPGDLGQAYLGATSHAYGGPEAAADPSFAERVGAAEAFVHGTDTRDRDILDGDDTAEVFGGFNAAAAAMAAAGRRPPGRDTPPPPPAPPPPWFCAAPPPRRALARGGPPHPGPLQPRHQPPRPSGPNAGRRPGAAVAGPARQPALDRRAVAPRLPGRERDRARGRRPLPLCRRDPGRHRPAVRRGLRRLRGRGGRVRAPQGREPRRRAGDPRPARGGAPPRPVDDAAQLGRRAPRPFGHAPARGRGMSGMERASMRRGWCPSVLAPMATGDGLLVRLHPRAARLRADEARAVAAAARACGNGLLDISSRGNLQVRGLSPESHPRLVEMFAEAGLVPRSDHPAVMQACILSPLAGLDPSDRVDAAVLAHEIEAMLGSARDLDGLLPKFAVVVDGGGRMPLDDVDADVRLVAVGSRAEARLAVGLAAPNGPAWVGACAPSDSPAVIRRIASAFCDEVRQDGARRIRDLSPKARDRLAAAGGLDACDPPPVRAPGPAIGPIPLQPGRAAVALGPPFGRLHADVLDRLAAASERFGSGELRLSPWRSLVVPGVASRDMQTLLALAADAGLIVDPDDPRMAVTACAGAPACARATVATQADALRLADAAGHRLAGGSTVHLSGCAKACARREPADLTLVGEGGQYRVVVRGAAGDTPIARLPIAEILARLGAIPDGPLAALPEKRLAQAFAPEVLP